MSGGCWFANDWKRSRERMLGEKGWGLGRQMSGGGLVLVVVLKLQVLDFGKRQRRRGEPKW